jgi:two-component system, sensor histidine kinase YesM
MIIQPIVENAVFHGIEKKRSGSLSVTCRCTDEELHIEVRDDGKGMDNAELEALRRELSLDEHPPDKAPANKRGIGLLNIHRRISAFYGDRYGLEIESNPLSGTVVTMKLPVSSL